MSDSLWSHVIPPGSSMVFPRPEYWSGLPFPSPGNLPHPKTEPGSPALQADSSPTECQGSPPPLFFFPVGTYVLPIWKQTGVKFLALCRYVGWNWIFFFFFLNFSSTIHYLFVSRTSKRFRFLFLSDGKPVLVYLFCHTQTLFALFLHLVFGKGSLNGLLPQQRHLSE